MTRTLAAALIVAALATPALAGEPLNTATYTLPSPAPGTYQFQGQTIVIGPGPTPGTYTLNGKVESDTHTTPIYSTAPPSGSIFGALKTGGKK
jgi:hypothetical protein